MLSRNDMRKIIDGGIALTAEKDKKQLLARLVTTAIEIANCDAGTLYLYQNGVLEFQVMKTLSLHISRGERGEKIELPPVPMAEEHVCAYAAIHRELVNIPDVCQNDRFDFSGPGQYDALTGFHTRSMLVIPLEDTLGELIGVLQLMNALDEQGRIIPFGADDEYVIRALGSLAAVSVNNMRYLSEIKQQLYSFVEAFATAVDERTPYNGSHTRKVTAYAGILADYINRMHEEGKCGEFFDGNRREQLILAAALHDIGKMIIPLSVMNKQTRLGACLDKVEQRFLLLAAYYEIDMLRQRITETQREEETSYLTESMAFIREINHAGILPAGARARVRDIASRVYRTGTGEVIPYLTEYERECLLVCRGTLTEQERRQMESHVIMTEKILDKVHFGATYSKVACFATTHHELLDGSGYPKHLKGEALELESRILAVVDIYDALTSADRPYKKPLPQEEAFLVLYAMADEGKLEMRLVAWLKAALAGMREEEIEKWQMF